MARRRRSTVVDGLAPFAACSRTVRRQVAAHTDVLRPAPGDVLARQGSVAREVVVVVAGRVEVERDGRRSAELGPGASFGGAEVLTGEPHPCTIVAGPGVELRVVNGPAYRAVASRVRARNRS